MSQPDAARALATTLNLDSVDDLWEELAFDSYEPEEAGRHGYVFERFPSLPPWDVSEEGLPPGLPSEIVAEGGPGRDMLWNTTLGDHVHLVVRWLCSVHGWTHVHAHDLGALVADMPSRGRVVATVDSMVLSDLRSGALPAVGRLLVVGRPWSRKELFRPAAIRAAGGQDVLEPWDEKRWSIGMGRFIDVANDPDVGAWLRPLVFRVAERLPPSSKLHGRAEAVVGWWDANLMDGDVQTPADVLALLCLLDQRGPGRMPNWHHGAEVSSEGGSASEEALAHWLTSLGHGRRGASAVRAALLGVSSNSGGGGRTPLDQLVEAEMTRLSEVLPRSLPATTWARLLPSAPIGDLPSEPLLEALEDGSPEALTEARRLMALEGVGVADALRHFRVLSPTAEGEALCPPFVARWAMDAARSRLERQGVRAWGVLLGHPETARAALENAMDAVCHGDLHLLEEVEGEDQVDSDPDLMLALDGAVRAAAVGAACGEDATAWQEHANALLPMVRRFPQKGVRDMAWASLVAVADTGEGLTATSPVVSLAARAYLHGVAVGDDRAVVRALAEAAQPRSPEGGDWSNLTLEYVDLTDPDARRRVGVALKRLAEARPAGGMTPALATLIDRVGQAVRATLGLVSDTGAETPPGGLAAAGLQPDQLIDLYLTEERGQSTLAWRQLLEPSRLWCLPFPLPLLYAACERRGVRWQNVVSEAWQVQVVGTTAKEGMILPGQPQRPTTYRTRDERYALWSCFPANAARWDTLDAILSERDAQTWIGDDIWRAFVWAAMPPATYRDVWSVNAVVALWRVAPASVLFEWIESQELPARDARVGATLWTRFPDRLVAWAETRCQEDDVSDDQVQRIAAVLAVAPAEQWDVLVDMVVRWAAESEPWSVRWRVATAWSVLLAEDQRGPWKRVWRAQRLFVC